VNRFEESVLSLETFPDKCNVKLELIRSIRKLQRILGGVNSVPEI
jgi:hypothetical protein